MIIILGSFLVLGGFIIFGFNSLKNQTDEKDVAKPMKPAATQTSKDSVEKKVESKPKEKSQAVKDAEAIKLAVENESKKDLQARLKAQPPTESTNFKPKFSESEAKEETDKAVYRLLQEMTSPNDSADEISTWFSDFDEANRIHDEWLNDLKNEGMSVDKLTHINMYEGEYRNLGNYTWSRIVKVEYVRGGDKLVRNWKFVLKPDSLGNLRIMIMENL